MQRKKKTMQGKLIMQTLKLNDEKKNVKYNKKLNETLFLCSGKCNMFFMLGLFKYTINK